MKVYKSILILLLLVLLSSCSKKIYPIYDILDIYNNADIDYARIDSLNNIGGGYNLINTVFLPQSGNYKIIRFLSTDYGTIFDEHDGFTHNLLLIKVDENDEIIESYLYFLENPVMPLNGYLLKSTKHIPLKNRMRIKSLKFEIPEESLDNKHIKYLKSNGQIVMPENWRNRILLRQDGRGH